MIYRTSPYLVLFCKILARQAMTALELRRAAISAEAERARHRATVGSARDFATIVADLEGLITDWSAGAQTIFGWVENEGEPIATIFTSEDRAAGAPQQEMSSADNEGRGRMSAGMNGAAVSASGRAVRSRLFPAPQGTISATSKSCATARKATWRRKRLQSQKHSCVRRRRPAGSDFSPSPVRSTAAQQLLA
jgi:PAS domain-containing protein